MRISTLDFSQARIAPESVMRGLELLDPTACIVHLHGMRWLVGKVRESSEARAQAEAMLDHWTKGIRMGAQLTTFAKQRVRFAQLARLGFRPVQQYDLLGAPDGRIVRDFAISRFLWLHSHEDQPLRDIDLARESKLVAAQADLTDIGRARDAHRYAFTRSHMPSVSLTPTVGPKSGFVRHVISPT